MIQTTLLGCAWGTQPIEENLEDGGTATGINLNLQDPGTGQVFTIPFTGDSLKELVKAGIGRLTDEQKRELSPLLTGGVILPGSQMPKDFRKGGQG